ncbi:cytochrome P450/oxidoreductase [Hoeflea sp. G2-23]|uniref:Cytochrome P450/oxidoreductase n=1 Tax=Hoeflea algicola TaxID=2983763 RepID=A0ABT3Z9Y8_9HYPH|nr:cytochrome P450/oxidoreductase [Hoeflea algicola]MCY0148144.1 cytochrome P450/oxidoreductase [Hoeflea algicola]
MVDREAGARGNGAVDACPAHAAAGSGNAAMGGCPVSPQAAAFDPFSPAYLANPAEALKWSREQEPVFYNPELGYWVVSLYDDVKAVFRDNITFSPSIALERVVPPSEAALATLKRYNYAMNRTLVNEDEPAHMERRRALMDHFLPANLAQKEPMIRRLTREKVDAFIDNGRVDLVEAMLWEIPLTVALHFLGVPKEDMDRLKEFSVAHTVNTWGKPSPEQQLHVAESVGRFWQYAGQVLDKMRQEPDGQGWMHQAIRKNAEIPDVVTDSYLHSMMMAIIVAGHETTALASTNALKLLLSNRLVWERICNDPALIPNAVEECLRLEGSVVAWRRQATRDTEIAGIAIPKDAKLLIVSASANHDPRHFENSDFLDIYRDSAAEHLTFGYGSHQCMGKNFARLEMRIFIEELCRRLPHMRLVEGQQFTYLPNLAFRGPQKLEVEWDPANNPERTDPAIVEREISFPVGAPTSKEITRSVRVAEISVAADGIKLLRLEDPDGLPLPAWTPGAHIDLVLGAFSRKYSLCGDPSASDYTIAVLREENGRGGSQFIHEELRPGMTVRLRGPKNYFRLEEQAGRHVLIAGGIGITPIVAMADRLKQIGADYVVHYCGRSRGAMALADRLIADHGEHAVLHVSDESGRADLAAIICDCGEDVRVHACGPQRLLDALARLCADRPEGMLKSERFTTDVGGMALEGDTSFEIELEDSNLTLTVPAGETLLDVVRAAGIDVPSDCEEGLCGSCEVRVLEGGVDHRDRVLSTAERAEGGRMMACCSRSAGGMLRLAL